MVVVRRVAAVHPRLEGRAAADLAGVLQDEGALADALPGPHPPALLGRHEPLQSGRVLPPLDRHVAALRAVLAHLGVALCVGGAVDAARAARLLLLLPADAAGALLGLVVPEEVWLLDVGGVLVLGELAILPRDALLHCRPGRHGRRGAAGADGELLVPEERGCHGGGGGGQRAWLGGQGGQPLGGGEAPHLAGLSLNKYMIRVKRWPV